MSEFRDHFSDVADAYSRHRPRYPAALFGWLAECAPARGDAWDCATGNGQAAHGIAEHFDHVIATDASAEQISNAVPHANVTYRVAYADRSGLPSDSMDLITVAQALHWFDVVPFFEEVRRVGRPGALFCAWCYGDFTTDEEVAEVLAPIRALLQPWWPPERAILDGGYRSILLPFDEIMPPPFEMRLDWNAGDLLGYLRTWSARRRFIEAGGDDPLVSVEGPLRDVWGEERRVVRWPLSLRVGRVDADVRGAGSLH
jgi:SAM-dependent methyltransferase